MWMQKTSWLLSAYSERQKDATNRLKDFKNIWKAGNDSRLFEELCFCLLTPQSRAKICWQAICNLRDSGALFDGNEEIVLKHLKGVRFPVQKSKRIVMAREKFFGDSSRGIKNVLKELENLSNQEKREWLVDNIYGYGYKEAAHFLRNVGFYEDISILDRHILKNLVKLEVIGEVPKTLTKKKYFEIEQKMRKFCEQSGLTMAELDLVLWSQETGEIFK